MSDQDDFDMPEDQQDNSAFRQLREHTEKLEKELKAERKRAGQLEEFKAKFDAEQRAAQVHQVFTEKGLQERDARLYLELNPNSEPTEEAISAFVEKWELGVPATSQQPEEEKPATVRTYDPLMGGMPGQSQQRISYEEYVAARTDPAKFAWAIQMSQKGLVDDR